MGATDNIISTKIQMKVKSDFPISLPPPLNSPSLQSRTEHVTLQNSKLQSFFSLSMESYWIFLYLQWTFEATHPRRLLHQVIIIRRNVLICHTSLSGDGHFTLHSTDRLHGLVCGLRRITLSLPLVLALLWSQAIYDGPSHHHLLAESIFTSRLNCGDLEHGYYIILICTIYKLEESTQSPLLPILPPPNHQK